MKQNSTTNTYSILYVDDEEKTLKYFSRFFSKDYSILTAKNTSEAKAILDEQADNIGVLISDQRMPVEKGVELLKYSRENYPHIIRLLTTAYSDLADAIEAVNRGEILRYIPKPWDINFLELEIRHAMRFFQLNKEREQLRHEKLSVIQRVTAINRVKDLIIFATGLTHVRNPLHAIRAFLMQLPDYRAATLADTKHQDLWELIKNEISEMNNLAQEILQDTRISSGADFEQLDILQTIKTVNTALPVKINYNIDADSTVIDGNPVLIDKFMSILLNRICERLDTTTDNINISMSGENTSLCIHVNSYGKPEDIDVVNTPAWLLSAFFICYHHGGSIEMNNGITIRLPYSQKDAGLKALAPSWQEEIINRYEVLPV